MAARVPDRPALLGGTPMFRRQVLHLRPAVPRFEDVEADLRAVLTNGAIAKGRFVAAFEEAAASYLGVKHAVAVSSGTAGLMLTHRALGLASAAILPSYTSMASASALVWAGIQPLFAEVDEASYNIDPRLIDRVLTTSTTGVVATHMLGNPAAIDKLTDLCRRHRLTLVFDAAHAFGSAYDGSPVGRQGAAHVFSFGPGQPLTAGEGGLVATHDERVAKHVRLGRDYGRDERGRGVFAGINARMTEASAVLALHGLERLEDALESRNNLARCYRSHLASVSGLSFQCVSPRHRSSYRGLSVTVTPSTFGLTRDALEVALAAERVETAHGPGLALHRQPAVRAFSERLRFPITDRLADATVCLPLWARMDPGIAERVSAAIERIQAYAEEVAAVVVGQTPTVASGTEVAAL